MKEQNKTKAIGRCKKKRQKPLGIIHRKHWSLGRCLLFIHVGNGSWRRNGWLWCSVPPWLVGRLTATILLLVGSGSLAVKIWPATVTELQDTWKDCSVEVVVVVLVLATVAREPGGAVRHTRPPTVTHTHKPLQMLWCWLEFICS